jgi:glucan phosphorylase
VAVSQNNADLNKMKVAYFCAEFALESDMPTYAGGLGVLAGDYILESADSSFPITGVSLLYKKGQNNNIKKSSRSYSKLKIARQGLFKKLLISIPIGTREVFAQVWRWQKKDVSVYFLDTDIHENSPEDREITKELYVEDRDKRLQQELILGLGGAILLEKLKITPDIYHLNEGHSGFLSLYLLSKEISAGKSWTEAFVQVKRKIVFTNHTLVLEGQEVFAREPLFKFAGKFCESVNINFDDFYALGLSSTTDALFSMTTLALNTAGLTNAVSKIHGEKARELWTKWPIIHITNGIYLPRWDKVGSRDIVKAHEKNESILLKEIKKVRGKDWNKNGLLLGWSRRFVPYKRPLALLEDIEKLKNIANFFGGKVHIVYSAPLGDEAAGNNEYLKKIKGYVDGELADLITFLPNYRTDLAEKLVAGCDVWLNTPIVGREACGTSGMKAALNGALTLSTNDGWVNEIDISGKGWLVDDKNITSSLLDTLEKKILPDYIKNSIWPSMMSNSRKMILDNFSTKRMLKEYIEKLYEPVLKSQKNV